MTTHVVADAQLGTFARRQNDLFRRVREGTLPIDRVMAGLQSIIEGNFDAIPAGLNHFADADASPFIPDNCTVVKHRRGGQVDVTKLGLYVDDHQKAGIEGTKLQKFLEGKPTKNACVLDYLLANTGLIPLEWKGQYVVFWDTEYRDSDGRHFVRYLCCRDGRWCWSYWCLDGGFDAGDPAAVSRE